MSDSPTLTVKGTGQASLPADTVVLTLDNSATALDYDTSMQIVNDKVEKVRSGMEKIGIGRKKIKTQNYRIRPTEEKISGKWVFAGYETTHDLRIEFDFDKDILNEVLGFLATSDIAPDLSISFTTSRRKELEDLTLKDAIQNARHKAKIIASSLNKQIGSILRVEHNWANIEWQSDMMFSHHLYEAEAMPDLEPEDIEQRHNVEIVWELIEK